MQMLAVWGLVLALSLNCCKDGSRQKISAEPLRVHHGIMELSKLVELGELGPSEASWQISPLTEPSRGDLIPGPSDWMLLAEITLNEEKFEQLKARSPALTGIQSLSREELGANFKAAKYGVSAESLSFTHSAQEFAKSPLLTGYLGLNDKEHKVLLYMLAL